mmetsp:Transcript_14547/g.40949  ORF Transcript_14547/g.40949 Transcript_14547/m.40949 type:complete len:182 (-) Transcript_14547:1407-1952(-)
MCDSDDSGDEMLKDDLSFVRPARKPLGDIFEAVASANRGPRKCEGAVQGTSTGSTSRLGGPGFGSGPSTDLTVCHSAAGGGLHQHGRRSNLGPPPAYGTGEECIVISDSDDEPPQPATQEPATARYGASRINTAAVTRNGSSQLPSLSPPGTPSSGVALHTANGNMSKENSPGISPGFPIS